MNTKVVYFLLIPLLGLSQQKKDWFFGAEIGLNTITSHSFIENKKSLQGGLVAEYYMNNHWSLTGKIKYFETSVSYFRAGTNGSLFSSDTKALIFTGSVLSMPLTIKWNHKLFSKFTGNVRAGFAYNLETKSNYELAINTNTNRPKSFGCFVAGLGLEYNINPKNILFLELETNQLGGYKGNDNGLVFPTNYYTTNNLLNIGIKHNFKK